MAWPNKVYVATQALGVYYTETFAGPSGGQPAWAAVNDGLPTLDVRQFALDPHYNAGRQYLILGTDRIIYRRELGGAWTAVLTPADVDTLLSTTGCTISRFCLDPSLPGRLWATVGSVYLFGTPNGYWAIYSDDYGDTWNATTKAYTGGYTRGLGQVRSYGDNVWFATCTGAGGSGRIRTSTDRGATWGLSDDMGFSEWTPVVHLNPFFTSKIYSRGNGYGGPDLVQMLAGTQTVLQSSLGPPRDDSMWFSASVADLQRLIKNGYIYQTDDEWETVNTPSICSPTPVSVALWSGDDEDQMILGLDLGDHVVGALASPSETTPVGLAGSSPDSSPYTDSIPNTCGGVAIGGVAAVYEGPSEGPTPPGGSTITPPDKPGESPSTPITLGGDVLTQAVTMPDYTGDDRGEPLPGDRAAWDVVDYPALHARDLKDDTPVHHVPEGDAAGDAPVWDGAQWVSTGVATQAELDAHEGEANPHGTELGDLADVDLTTDPPEDGEGLVWDEAGGEWVPADVTTLGDHDHSGDAGDGGTFDAANLTSGAATDGQVLTADGAGNAAWEDASGGGGGGHEILDDGTPMTQRAALDFVGFDLADDDYGDATIVSLPEGAYAETVGDGVGTTFDVEHSLNTTDVVVQVWDLDATPTELVTPDVYVIDADTVRVTFGSAPDTDQMRVVVVKGGGGGGEGVGFANPMTTAGDIITGGAGGTAGRLGIGTAGQVLKVNAGATAPEWGDESGGGGGGPSYDLSAIGDLVMWLESGEGITSASGYVSQWDDQSGNDYHATQVTGARRPLLLGETPQGYPAVAFDGSDDFLSSAATPASGADPRTIVLVCSASVSSSGPSYSHLLHYGTASTRQAYGITVRTSGNAAFGNHYWSDSGLSVAWGECGPAILLWEYDGTDDWWYWNGMLVGSKTVALSTGTTSGIIIGSRINAPSECGRAWILEVAAFSKCLNSTERDAVFSGLSTKFGIPVS